MLRAALDADEPSARLGAVELLGWLGPEPADLELLAARLGDKVSSVRAAAHAALGTNEPDAATAARLRAWARGAIGDGSPAVRLGAVETLGWLGPEPADLELLAAQLADQDSDVRAAVVGALVRPGLPTWSLSPGFVELAQREAARMTLERASTWAYTDGTLASFFSTTRPDSSLGIANNNDDLGVAIALALRAGGIAAAAWPRVLELAHHPGAGELTRFVLRLLAGDEQRPLLDLLGDPQTTAWDRLGDDAEAAGRFLTLFQAADGKVLPRLRQEAAFRLAEAAQQPKRGRSPISTA